MNAISRVMNIGGLLLRMSAELFTKARVAVIGDLMLDCYLHGDVRRISPEAPVPVVHVKQERVVPGGAANVCANLAALCIDVIVVGICGADQARTELFDCLDRMGRIDHTRVICTPTRATTRKLRVIGASQQIVRVDFEEMSPCSNALDDACTRAAVEAVGLADVVILSDYGKGVCSSTLLAASIRAGVEAKKCIIIDPKRTDFRAYRGATIVTPNRKELSEATQLPCESDDEVRAAVEVAQDACNAAILLTRSEKGMSYYPLNGEPIHMPTVAQDVFDVSGAGDTVVATLAAALASGLPIEEAMRLANHAAGVVVSKIGTATVSLEELVRAAGMESPSDLQDGAVLELAEAIPLRRVWLQQRLTVGMVLIKSRTITTDEILSIQRAATHADRIFALMEIPDAQDPECTEQNVRILGALRVISATVLTSQHDSHQALEQLQVDYEVSI